MPISIAMPIAHVTTMPIYTAFYNDTECILGVTEYFNQPIASGGICKGFRITRSPAAPPVSSDEFNLFAFTDGFLSLQNSGLVLRLPRELNHRAHQRYNSGTHFLALDPKGPQLRHVIYQFESDPSTIVSGFIHNILSNVSHPGRQISRIPLSSGSGPTILLNNYLSADPANLDLVLQDFLNGRTELFVTAGDAIGDCSTQTVEIRFLDSCGSVGPAARTNNLPSAQGRPISPSYFLYLVRHARNAAQVRMLTSFQPPPNELNDTHPLDHLLSEELLDQAGANLELFLDVTAAVPPKPLHYTVDVTNGAAAARGIAVDNLGDWHESRNAANPYNTAAPVQWRYYGGLSTDTTVDDYCKFRTQVKAGQDIRLPGGTAFNHQFPPTTHHSTTVTNYWQRYGTIFNAIATAFELPCELLVVIACKETAAWFNVNLANSRDMNVIRMEPLPRAVNVISNNPGQRALLNNYLAIAGGVGGTHNNGANVDIPIPWNGNARLTGNNQLTWTQLAQLVRDFSQDVRISPSVMQTLISTARSDTNWIAEIYGANYINQIGITLNGINLVADTPPPDLDDLFSDWFGVAVDAAGNNTNNQANVHNDLSKMKRALHAIVAGAAHMKRRYNTVEGRGARRFNMITDFDLPTLASGYNDGAVATHSANPGDSIDEKWKRLFALVFFGSGYPMDGPRYFNAAISYFNGNPAPTPQPVLRLWRA